MADGKFASAAVAAASRVVERAPLPDTLTRLGIRALVARSSRALAGTGLEATAAFAREMKALPIAVHTEAANAQHYEVPAEFFALVLGPQRKYSCCLYASPETTLAEAEEEALAETAAHAQLADGQTILELGCGWGSLSLWMARKLPNARITSVSNSRSQRAYIERSAGERGLTNLSVVTADANTFRPEGRFDRIVSVEMFEHMSNWHQLLARTRDWLAPDGRLFLHVFTHRAAPYRFDHNDPADWIGNYFFTGGIMPSVALIGEFPELFRLEESWFWNGGHYERTAEDWLLNFDRNSEAILMLFRSTYGDDARVWHRRWRLFFMATEGLFGHANGQEWGVSHYLLSPSKEPQPPASREIVGASA